MSWAWAPSTVKVRIAPFPSASPTTRSQLTPASRARAWSYRACSWAVIAALSNWLSHSIAAPRPMASRIGGVPASNRCGGEMIETVEAERVTYAKPPP